MYSSVRAFQFSYWTVFPRAFHTKIALQHTRNVGPPALNVELEGEADDEVAPVAEGVGNSKIAVSPPVGYSG